MKRNNYQRPYEDYLRFLTETRTDEILTLNTATNEFFQRTRARLDNETSFNNFLRFFQWPHPATALASKIWIENGKVFSATDQLLNFHTGGATTPEPPSLDLWQFWRGAFWEAYKFAPGSMFVFERPDSLIRIDTAGIMEYECDAETDKITLLKYMRGEYTYTYTPTTFTREKHQGAVEQLPVYYIDIPAFEVSARVIDKRFGTRGNVLAPYISELADYLFFAILGKINKGFGYYNTTVQFAPEHGCNHETLTEKCDSGYLISKIPSESGEVNLYDITGARKTCPSCNRKPTIGGVVRIPVRAIKDFNTQTEAIQFVSPDISALEYSAKDLQQVAESIYQMATGESSAINETALNSVQAVLLSIEGQTAMLNQIAADIEQNMRRSAEVLGQLTYGTNFQGVTLKIGSDYMVSSLAQVVALKAETDPLGLSDALGINSRLLQLASDGNESMHRRGAVILALNDIIGIEATRQVIAKFELENPINSVNLPANEIIKQVLKLYQNEERRSESDSSGDIPEEN